MLRKTKIVATLGPASSERKVLEQMIHAGVDVVRINFSHGTAQEHIQRVEMVRAVASELGVTVGVMVDLQGPKIRIGKFEGGKIALKPGDNFILDADCKIGNQQRVGLDYRALPQDVEAGATLLLDDGRIVMGVNEVRGNEILCVVEHGGVLSNNKGINRKGGGLSAKALTEKDMEDIKVAAQIQAAYLAVSFPRSGEDINWARQLLREAGGNGAIIAKIERAEAIPALADILDASDAIMVARGDLSVEVGDAAVPALQKRMIRMARAKNKVVITATQMMESMITSPIPTRAEVSDVANAVLDGTDAVMLSAETAAGQYPVETVAAMARVCIEAEKEYYQASGTMLAPESRRTNQPVSNVEEAIARATNFVANNLNIKAIAAFTQSGRTALLVSRMNSSVPIYALTPEEQTRRKATLYRGVYPVKFDVTSRDPEQTLIEAESELLHRGAVQPGDLIAITIGEPFGRPGGTNSIKIVKVGEHRRA